MMGLIQAFESGLASVMALLRFEIGNYCDLETADCDEDGYGAVIAKDGSMATIIEYHGFKTMLSEEDYIESLGRFALSAQSYLGTKGHQIQVVFSRDIDPQDAMDLRLSASYQTAARLEMDVAPLLDESKKVMAQYCCDESVFFVLWTRPSLLAPVEVAMYRKELKEAVGAVPPMKNAQSPLRTIRFLVDRHHALVSKFLQDLKNMHGSATQLDVRTGLREVKRSLFASTTPANWKPQLLGDPVYTRWVKESGRDVSAALPVRLHEQIMSVDANIGDKRGIGGVTDTRAVRIGSRIYAPCFVKTFPQRALVFDSLFRDMNNATTHTQFGQKPMPWRLSFMIEGDGLTVVKLKKIFAGILGLTSESNRNLLKASNSLSNYKSEGGAVVKIQISAATWVEYGEERELMLRRSKLTRALMGWGDSVTNEETGDPIDGMVSCSLGMTYKSIAPATAGPLPDVLAMLPLARPASPFNGGHVLFRTMDGKILPYEMFSAEQATWITLIFAGPGSGKSVLLNRLNVEMCWSGGLTRLPWICVIDIGVSSSGFISLVRESLPEHEKHKCLYVRLQNTPNYTINPFDTMLGMRTPLERERDYMANFLTMLATSPESKTAEKGMRQFCGLVVDAMFKSLSDKNERGTPREYVHGQDEIVTTAVNNHGIPHNTATKWYSIVDALFSKGEIHAAYRAQRYAMPTLTDAVRAGSDPDVIRDFNKLVNDGISIDAQFRLMVTSAISEYPIFSGQTVFDVGEARLMALDLNDVVTSGSDAARKKAALMYMTARNLFVKKIAISEEDLPSIPDKYRPYHTERFNEIKEDFKRIAYDEYHKTGGDQMLTNQVETDGREGRKWGLEVMVSSQLPEDFRNLSKLATTIMILDAGNVQTRKTIQETFGLSQAELHALINNVHGATSAGATFLGKFHTGESDYAQLFTSTMGPQMLWGLATGQEDRFIRDALYRRLGAPEARRALAARFPKGSCRSYVQKLRQRAKAETDSGWIDDDVAMSLLTKLANDIGDDYVKKNNVEDGVLAG
jgi:intracellular multiplication protein IcmB